MGGFFAQLAKTGKNPVHVVHQFGDRKFSGNLLFCELGNALPIPANPISQCLCDSVVNELRFLG
jgi:hypothetical protein